MNKNSTRSWMLSALITLGVASGLHAHGDHPHGQVNPAALDSLYASYLTIQKSLAKDDAASARKESEDFLKKPIELPSDLSHSVKTLDLLKDYRALSTSKDLQESREAFRGLSEKMVVLMSEAYKGNDSALVFFCPMANDKKGARWIQDGRKTANPYYGKSMPSCGSVKASLSSSPEQKNGQNESEVHHSH